MAIHTEIHYATPDDLLLDAKNPRLGRENTNSDLSQHEVLELMKDWTLDELAVSFLESGFWPQEALLVVEHTDNTIVKRVVVEGNRRLAALRLLFAAKSGVPSSRKWQEIAASGSDDAFRRLGYPSEKQSGAIPYLIADAREDIESYLGFRHVTGIKEWPPAEKAEYISRMVDGGMSYQEVMRRIGSKTETVRRNYIAYRALLQMESLDDQIAVSKVEDKFSVLFLSLRTRGVQDYLGIEIEALPAETKSPIPTQKLAHLVRFAGWLFGTHSKLPLVTDSRHVDKFARVLESSEALEYLESVQDPVLETAFRLAGGEELETVTAVERAAFLLEQALGTAHLYVENERLVRATQRVTKHVSRLLTLFPQLQSEHLKG